MAYPRSCVEVDDRVVRVATFSELTLFAHTACRSVHHLVASLVMFDRLSSLSLDFDDDLSFFLFCPLAFFSPSCSNGHVPLVLALLIVNV